MRLARTCVWLPAGLLAAVSAAAQMSVDLTLGQTTFVLGEPIRVDVRIANHATSPFVVTGAAQEPNALVFEIVDRAGETLDTFQPRARLLSELLLAGGETHACAFNLDEWYPLRRNGRFFVQARLRRDQMRYDSAKRVIDVVPGLELARAVQLFADRPDEARTLSLVYWARRQAEFLFLRVTDAPGDRILTTVELGLLLRTTPPSLAISPEGEVTVTHRATQDAFLTTRLRSVANGLDLIKQERILDREAVNAMRMQYQEAAGAATRQEQQRRWWWPFGGGSGAGQGKAKKP